MHEETGSSYLPRKIAWGEGSSFIKRDDSKKTEIMIILTLKIATDTLCTGSFNIQKLILPHIVCLFVWSGCPNNQPTLCFPVQHQLIDFYIEDEVFWLCCVK
jgi:hypothetical protein